MFTPKELEASRDIIDRKKEEILNSKEGSDVDYIRDLQTLIKLKGATEEKLEAISRKAPRKERSREILTITKTLR